MTHTTLPPVGRKGDHFMNTQLYMAFGTVQGRVWTDQDRAIFDATLTRKAERRARRGRHVLSR